MLHHSPNHLLTQGDAINKKVIDFKPNVGILWLQFLIQLLEFTAMRSGTNETGEGWAVLNDFAEICATLHTFQVSLDGTQGRKAEWKEFIELDRVQATHKFQRIEIRKCPGQLCKLGQIWLAWFQGEQGFVGASMGCGLNSSSLASPYNFILFSCFGGKKSVNVELDAIIDLVDREACKFMGWIKVFEFEVLQSAQLAQATHDASDIILLHNLLVHSDIQTLEMRKRLGNLANALDKVSRIDGEEEERVGTKILAKQVHLVKCQDCLVEFQVFDFTRVWLSHQSMVKGSRQFMAGIGNQVLQWFAILDDQKEHLKADAAIWNIKLFQVSPESSTQLMEWFIWEEAISSNTQRLYHGKLVKCNLVLS
jgi:hypothetical protein